MIEVFATSVNGRVEADGLIGRLQQQFSSARINIDLHDHDRVLRMEGGDICCDTVMEIVRSAGYRCERLE